jgi:hypothetical protein
MHINALSSMNEWMDGWMLYIHVGPGPLLRCHIHVGKGRWTAGISYTVVGGAHGNKNK